MKQYTGFFIFFAVVLIIFILASINTPTEIDWSYNFSGNSKAPYGAYVIHSQLPRLFKTNISVTDLPFNELGELRRAAPSSTIFITNKYGPSLPEIDSLEAYVKEGNNVFIAAVSFDDLEKKLAIKTTEGTKFDGIGKIEFTSPDFAKQGPLQLHNQHTFSYFEKDTNKGHDILAVMNNIPILVRVTYGAGHFFLCTLPVTFTNYHILFADSTKFPFLALSYLPENAPVYWDEFHKPLHENYSPVKYILNQPALSWAYHLAIGTIVLFLIFAGKRKQRIIRIVKPYTNATIDFIKTVAELYRYSASYKNIAKKRIAYFFEKLRAVYHLQQKDLDGQGFELIAAKSAMPLQEVSDTILFLHVSIVKNKINRQDLFEINRRIESFYKKANIHG